MDVDRPCVYCGSHPGGRPVYPEAAERLGRALAERGVELVYGARTVGLMGAIAGATLDPRRPRVRHLVRGDLTAARRRRLR